MPKSSNSGDQGHNFYDLSLNGLDDSVTPAIVAYGVMGKDTGGSWHYANVSASGYLMVSGTFGSGTFTAAPLSADSSKVSAVQGDAGLLRISAIGGTAGDRTLVDGTTQTISATLTPISAKPAGSVAGLVTNTFQQDAGQLRVSAVGVTVTTSPLSADSSRISAVQGDAGILHTSASLVDDGSITKFLGRVSALGVTVTGVLSANQQISAQLLGGTSNIGSVSAVVNNSLSATADNFRVSAFSPDAGLFHVSGIGTFTVNTQETVSAFINQGTISAYSPDASLFRISAINSISALSPDAGLFHISGFTSTATNFPVSAVQADAGLQHTSAFVDSGSVSAKSALAAQMLVSASQGSADQLRVSAFSTTAANLAVSAAQVDAGAFHTSASIMPDTTGGLTTFSNFNVSSSQTIKSTAGAVYGWYAWNMSTVPVYINLYNTSGAINVGTDAIQVQIALAASAAANMIFPIGLKGFTNGIGVAAVSGATSASTTPTATSATGLNLFYK